MVGRLDRYLFSTAAIAFLAVLTSLTTMVWLTQVLRRFDLLAAQGQSLLIFLTVTALALPMLMLVIAPIALFIAIVYTLNRFNADSELVVMAAAGVSRWRVFRPLMVLAVMVAMLSVYVSAELGPWTLRTLRDQIAKVNADIVANVAMPGRFTTIERGLTFHIRERGSGGTLAGIFVHDVRDPANEATYIAERGRIVRADTGMYLVLDSGLLQRAQGPNRNPNFVEFQRYAFDLSQFGNAAAANTQYRATDRPISELVNPPLEDPIYKQDPSRFRTELHKRLSAPLYPFAAFIIAFAFLGEARTTRQSRGMAMTGAAAAFAAVEIAGFGTSGFVARSALAAPLPYVIPLIGIAFGMFWIAGGSRVRVPAFIERAANAITARIERLQSA